MTVVGEQEVEGQRGGRTTFSRGVRLDAVARRRFVVGRVGEFEDAVEPRAAGLSEQAPRAVRALPAPALRSAIGRPATSRYAGAPENGLNVVSEPEEDADRPRPDLAAHREAVAGRGRDPIPEFEPRRPMVLGRDGDGERAPRSVDHRPHQRELSVEIAEVGDDLEHAGATDGARNADEFLVRGAQRRRRLAPARAVVRRARRRESERSRRNCVTRDATHRVDVVGSGASAARAPRSPMT